MLKIFIRIAWAISFGVSGQAFAMTHAEFVRHFISTSEQSRAVKANLARSRGEYESSVALHRTTLALTPVYRHEETAFQNSTDEDSQKGLFLETEIKQTTGLGLELGLSYSKYFDDAKPTESQSLTLSEPLFANAFGSADRASAQAAKDALAAAELRYKVEAIEVCGKAHDLYVSAWSAAEEYVILDESLHLADQALRATKVNYGKRLVKKIDFESAQADFLRLQDEVAQAKINMEKAKSELAQYWKDAAATSPIAINSIGIKDKKFSSLELKIARRNQSALAKEAEAEISRTRPFVALTASIGQNRAEDPALAPLDKATEDWYLIGIKSEWPIFDGTKSGARRAAKAKVAAAEAELRRAEKILPVTLEELKSQVINIQESITRHKERLKLRESQIGEAQRLLRLGKIEFEDYIRFRDLALRERLLGAKFEREGWKSLMELAAATGDDFGVCL